MPRSAFEPSEHAWQALHTVLQQSFAEHWGYVPVACDAFRASHAADPAPELPLWRVAVADGRMVGVACASGGNAEDGGGWVADLGVLASHRGRGIARALLQAVFEAYRRVGRIWVALMVDTENATGVVGLYESVGMHQGQSIDVYQRVVRPDAAMYPQPAPRAPCRAALPRRAGRREHGFAGHPRAGRSQ